MASTTKGRRYVLISCQNVHLMNVRECHFEADTTGYSPLHRPIDEHIQ